MERNMIASMYKLRGGQSHGDVQKHLVKREEKRKEVKGV